MAIFFHLSIYNFFTKWGDSPISLIITKYFPMNFFYTKRFDILMVGRMSGPLYKFKLNTGNSDTIKCRYRPFHFFVSVKINNNFFSVWKIVDFSNTHIKYSILPLHACLLFFRLFVFFHITEKKSIKTLSRFGIFFLFAFINILKF